MEENNELIKTTVEYTDDNIRHLDDMSISVFVRVCTLADWGMDSRTMMVSMCC